VIGQEIGQYRVIEQIGLGGMATVYKAYQANMDRYVALKALPRHFMHDPTFLGRFEREARTIARLEHPHILPVHDYGHHEGVPYLVMRYVEGGALSDLLRQHPEGLPLAEAARLIGQIASALDYAHQQGVIHRDIKPSNMLLDRTGNVLLTDFGIAKIAEATVQFTGQGTVGTPAYMSPEQAMGKELTPATDVYSLGVVLFEMLTGRVPYQAETPIAVINAHIYNPLPLPRSLRPDMPEMVERVLLKALAKVPEARYQTAGEMAAALSEAVHAAPVGPPEVSEETEPIAVGPTIVEEPALTPPVVTVPAPEAPSLPKAAPAKPARAGLPIWAIGALAVGGLLVIGLALGGVFARPAATPTPPPPPAEEVAPTLPPEPGNEEVPPLEEVPADEWGVVVVAPGDPVRVAVNVVTSGPVGALGLDELRGAEIAVEDYGEVLGHTVEIANEDTGCEAGMGQAAATKTVADESVVAVIGHTCSSSCDPAAAIYEAAHYTMVSPSCTAPRLTDPATHVASFLRTAFNDNYQGVVMAQFAYNELGARKAATINYVDDTYTGQIQAAFAQEFERLGGKVVAQETVNSGDTDMHPVLTAIAALGPDLIYAPIYQEEGALIAVQRADVGLGDVTMMSTETLWSESFSEAAGDAAVGVYVSGGGASGPEYDAFREKYLAAYGEEPPAPFHAPAYDAMNIILEAIETVAVEGEDGTLYIGREALREALYATSGYDGLSGTITCDRYGDCGAANIVIAQYRGEPWPEIVWTP
jgi:branched-chain amino acid transport system substrate-binding protein